MNSRRLAVFAAGVAVLTGCFGLGSVRAQSAANSGSSKGKAAHELLRFDVVSIKPTAPGDDKVLTQLPLDGTSFHGASVRMVLQTAFGVEDDRIMGAPSWVNTHRYDIEAKVAPEDAPRLDRLKGEDRNAMLIPLLTERLNLKYHHATRELPMFALVVAKGGPRLTKGEPTPPGGPRPPDPDHPEDPAKEHFKIYTVPGHIEADSIPMYILADQLSRMHILSRIVVDKTGLTGNYNFSLRWKPENTLPSWLRSTQSGLWQEDDSSDAVPSSLLTALQEQLGLKLQPEKSSVDVIVIDHIDPPSPN